MVILYKDPKGENIFDGGQSQGTLNISSGDDKIELSDLQKHCLDLETRLGKYEVSSMVFACQIHQIGYCEFTHPYLTRESNPSFLV